MLVEAICPKCGALMKIIPCATELAKFGSCTECNYMKLYEDPRLQDPDFELEMRRRSQRQTEIDFERMSAGLLVEEHFDIFRDELAADGPYGNIVKVDFKSLS